MRSTFKILFYINRSKVKNGLAPIMARITLNGTVAQFSCKISIEPHLWSVGTNRAQGRGAECKRINGELDEISAGLMQHYRALMQGSALVDATIIKNSYLGLNNVQDMFLKCFDRHNSDFLLRVGRDRSKETYAKYVIVRNHLAEFIHHYYRVEDISMRSVREEFIRRFQSYLSAQCSLASSTVWMYCIALRMIMSQAHKNGVVPTNPFSGYRITPQINERGYLLHQTH